MSLWNTLRRAVGHSVPTDRDFCANPHLIGAHHWHRCECGEWTTGTGKTLCYRCANQRRRYCLENRATGKTRSLTTEQWVQIVDGNEEVIRQQVALLEGK